MRLFDVESSIQKSLLAALLLSAGCGSSDIGIGVGPPPMPMPTMVEPVEPMPVTAPPVVVTPIAGAPIAQCSIDSVALSPFTETAVVDGSTSYDPEGLEIVSYDWYVADAPDGSSIDVPGMGAVRDVTLDQVGDYTLALVVRNSAGIDSAPCLVNVEAVPLEDLRVEMFWDQAGDDMDLHLISPGGTFGDQETDCFYLGCDEPNDPLDWGTLNFAADNPFLDRDDIPGTGPENIRIEEPAGGTYIVAIRDFGADPMIASTAVTVKVYVRGLLAFDETRDIVGDPAMVEFAEIDWPGGQVTAL